MSLLQIDNLSVTFDGEDGPVHAVNDLSLSIDKGETLGIVGESGSGKSQTAFSIMGLLAPNGRTDGSIRFDGQEILGAKPKVLNKLRAERIAMIFQDPMTSLNPYMRIADQMTEVLTLHKGMSKRDALAESVRMLDAVKIPAAKERIRLFPHEFSGGMRQRVMIAMSLLCKPDLLIADEPTTALDVTVQAQIMDLLGDLQKDFGMATILITHDLGVVAGFCERVLVMYGGRVMEQGPTEPLFAEPTHPYTRGLLAAVPRVDDEDATMKAIPGNPPNMAAPPEGCPFRPRCAYAGEDCRVMPPLAPFAEGRARACHRPIAEVTA
ncbi:Oligopeptide transport ATP-binding protein OppD (plasmid) [Sulfitobacter indolifex]|uniref:Oligopeptide transporter ATP-binding component n=1 Tax=Sulfitobacter indolifex HEL-45 TaxID=391624 RepID=A0ABP2D443_9RHOB|nr:oligopeptide/dipeptide ABC transporter ATP-binding protein [Sulfitobacter indolifex]EDQ02994.1 oligopeptide transporter ATP-binding component [Sulfitobacter indolifex HEL-45]UOA21111.1 Oligopeptide transport ATP-binding protein OppD [Sulfitobacter indolifex]